MAEIYLDDRDQGQPRIREILFERAYEGKQFVTRGQRESRPVTRADLEKRDVFDLFVALARQSEFPLPEISGNAKPIYFQKPHELPVDMKRSGFPAGDYLQAVDNLLNAKNRQAGNLKRTKHGDHRTGNMHVNTVEERVLVNLVDWMAAHLPKKTLKLPEPIHKEKKMAVTPSNRYRDASGELKQAFCEGMGADIASTGNTPFFTLFKDTLRRCNVTEISDRAHGGGYGGASRAFRPLKDNVGLGGLITRMFNPDVIAALEAVHGTKTHLLLRKDSTGNSTRIRHALTSKSQTLDEMLTPDDVFKIGYALHASGELAKVQKAGKLGFKLGAIPEIPEHLLNTLVIDEAKRAKALPPAAEEAAPKPLSVQIGRVTLDIRPQAGETLSIAMQEGEARRTREITLPADETAADFLAAVRMRVGRIKPELQGINVVEQAIRGYEEQRRR